MTVRRVPILIVGGGIGGLAAAIALAKRGREVVLIEKSPEFVEIGAGLQIAPNASRALDVLGVLPAVEPVAVFPKRMVWMDAIAGTQLTTLDLGAPFVERYGYRYFVMHRHDLLTALVAAARSQPRISLETSRTVTGVSDLGDAARAVCADGTAYDAALLIGADGLWSTVRAAIVDDAPICAQYVAYRGAIPIEQMSSHARLDDVMLWTGPEMHLVQYPLRRGELYNQVAVFRSRRYRPDSDDWGTPDELEATFGAGAEPVRVALTRIKRNRRWPMYDRLPIARWSRNRITLLGDAAHPMLQYLAQGACQALEDAVALADAVAQYGDDIGAALSAYEAARVARTARVQTSAREWGEYWHMAPRDAERRNLELRAHDARDYAPTDWLYAYDATKSADRGEARNAKGSAEG
ncbi:MAG: FAD-dependent monooxygenase [Candidatus Eremiobacteraeota bacterium]|nr:FAD-dependent monooxygenase [Candidatus Eremiobacteraeota bacterium]